MFFNQTQSAGEAPKVEYPQLTERWEYSAETKHFKSYSFEAKKQFQVDATNMEFIGIGADFMAIKMWDMNHGYIESGVIPTVPTGLPTPETPIKEQQRWSAVWNIQVGQYDNKEEKYKTVDSGNYNQLKEKYSKSYYLVVYAVYDGNLVEIRLKGKAKTYFWEFLSSSRAALTSKKIKLSEFEEVKIKKDTYFLPRFSLGSDITPQELEICKEKTKELDTFVSSFKAKQLHYIKTDKDVAKEVFSEPPSLEEHKSEINPEDLPF